MRAIRLTLVVAALSGAAQAGVVIKSVEADGPSVIYLDGNKLRIESDKQLLIFDGDRKEMISADPRKKTYSVATEQDMRAMGAHMKQQMGAQQEEMRKQMASMPPDQRKQMEEAMKQMGPAARSPESSARKHGSGATAKPVKYEQLGEKKTVAGHPCQFYKVVRGEDKEEKTCFISWSEGAVKKDELKPFEGFGRFMESMTEGIGISASRGEGTNQWAHELRNAPGIPAATMNASGKTTREIKSIDRTSIPADKFSAPSGYRKSAKPMFGE